MYILSRDDDFLRVLEVPAKITPIYERSPYHIGTELWNELPKSIQDCDDTYMHLRKKLLRCIGYMSNCNVVHVI